MCVLRGWAEEEEMGREWEYDLPERKTTSDYILIQAHQYITIKVVYFVFNRKTVLPEILNSLELSHLC